MKRNLLLLQTVTANGKFYFVDSRRVQCEAVALKIFEQLDRITSAAQYCGQVQQSSAAVEAEWCLLVADIIQKELEWK